VLVAQTAQYYTITLKYSQSIVQLLATSCIIDLRNGESKCIAKPCRCQIIQRPMRLEVVVVVEPSINLGLELGYADVGPVLVEPLLLQLANEIIRRCGLSFGARRAK
jgi:hypothetical protein